MTAVRSTRPAAAPRTGRPRTPAGAATARPASRSSASRSSTARQPATRRPAARRAPAARGSSAARTTPARTRNGARRSSGSTSATQRRSPGSRSAARSLPQESTGPFLRVLPTRRVSLRTTLLISSLLFFAVLAGAVTLQAQRIQGQHRLDGIETQLDVAREANRDLRASVAVAESPDRVMAEALAQGMVEPGPVLPLVSVSPVESDAAVRPQDGTTAP